MKYIQCYDWLNYNRCVCVVIVVLLTHASRPGGSVRTTEEALLRGPYMIWWCLQQGPLADMKRCRIRYGAKHRSFTPRQIKQFHALGYFHISELLKRFGPLPVERLLEKVSVLASRLPKVNSWLNSKVRTPVQETHVYTSKERELPSTRNILVHLESEGDLEYRVRPCTLLPEGTFTYRGTSLCTSKVRELRSTGHPCTPWLHTSV